MGIPNGHSETNTDVEGLVVELEMLPSSELFTHLGRLQQDPAERSFEGAESTLLHDAGVLFFNNLSQNSYNLLCGDAENSATVKLWMDGGTTALATGIATLLAPHLSIPVAVAATVATILVKLFYDSGNQTLCTLWKQRLPAAGGVSNASDTVTPVQP